MKSAKSPAIEANPGGRRSQPVRQTRTNPSRVSASALQRTASGRDSIGRPAPNQPIDIFPGVTHFADSIAALPKELIRHFTLLKEVDAKSSAPAEHIHELVQACLDSPFPRPKFSNDATSSSSATAGSPVSAAMSTQDSSSSILLNNAVRPAPSTDEDYQAAVNSPSNMARRQLFLTTAARMKDMLISLDEKNHVLSTANDVLQKQLSRIEDVWPHVEAEFSEEAKWGSDSHWAYPENRQGKPAQNERPRRDGTSAAAQQAAEEAAARSELRKQAVQAKKNQRNQAQDADGEDNDGRTKGETGKRSHAGKGRKTAEGTAGVGLGITPGGGANGANPPAKRRKVEKPVNGGLPTERAMSTVFGNNASKTKSASPRATPAPEGQKKRKALPSGPTQTKKSRNGANSAVASPVLGAFPDTKTSSRASPAPPTPVPRPNSSRSRQNPTPAAIETSTTAVSAGPASAKIRPSSSASNKPNGVAPGTAGASTPADWPRPSGESKPAAPEPVDAAKTEVTPTTVKEPDTNEAKSAVPVADKLTPKVEDEEKKTESPVAPEAPITTTATKPTPVSTTTPTSVPTATAATSSSTPTVTVTTTKSGRTSKPSKSALAEATQEVARSRSSRAAASETTAAAKPNQKKAITQSSGGGGSNNNGSSNGASRATASRASLSNAPRAEDEDDDDEGEEVDVDEQTYCYCNRVSYGAMVACDDQDCEREWFHLECVGLKVAPKTTVKWFCEDCLKRAKAGGKKASNR